MFGDWDWELMKEIGMMKAVIWFWGFMLIMVLILLNMLLAVIMEAYTAEKSKVENAETLVEQLQEMARRRRQNKAKERVRLNDVWDSFLEKFKGDEKEMMECKRMIFPEYLTKTVPGMKERQAKRTLVNSLKYHKHESEKHSTESGQLEHIQKTLDAMHKRQAVIEEDTSFVKETISYYDTLQVHGDPECDRHLGTGDGELGSAKCLAAVVNEMSSTIGGEFVRGTTKMQAWQDDFERQQDELHGLIAEMQLMAGQQQNAVKFVKEAIAQIGGQLEARILDRATGMS